MSREIRLGKTTHNKNTSIEKKIFYIEWIENRKCVGSSYLEEPKLEQQDIDFLKGKSLCSQ